MNIQNRLEKLEAKAFDGSADICKCFHPFEIQIIDPDSDKSDSDGERERIEWLKPIMCDKCGKRIERQVIEIAYTDGGTERRETVA